MSTGSTKTDFDAAVAALDKHLADAGEMVRKLRARLPEESTEPGAVAVSLRDCIEAVVAEMPNYGELQAKPAPVFEEVRGLGFLVDSMADTTSNDVWTERDLESLYNEARDAAVSALRLMRAFGLMRRQIGGE